MLITTIQCPVDDFIGTPRALHEHFDAKHREFVTLDKSGTKWFYELKCPSCTEGYHQSIRPGADDEFASEYEDEIYAVALDILLNHYLGEHVVGDLEGESDSSE